MSIAQMFKRRKAQKEMVMEEPPDIDYLDVEPEPEVEDRYVVALDYRTRFLTRIGALGTMAGYYALDAYHKALALPEGDKYDRSRQNYENIFVTNSKVNRDCRDAIVILDDYATFEALKFAIELVAEITYAWGDAELQSLWNEYRNVMGTDDGQS